MTDAETKEKCVKCGLDTDRFESTGHRYVECPHCGEIRDLPPDQPKETSAPREFWLRPIRQNGPTWGVSSKAEYMAGYKDVVHVIEYSAFDRLTRELAESKENQIKLRDEIERLSHASIVRATELAEREQTLTYRDETIHMLRLTIGDQRDELTRAKEEIERLKGHMEAGWNELPILREELTRLRAALKSAISMSHSWILSEHDAHIKAPIHEAYRKLAEQALQGEE